MSPATQGTPPATGAHAWAVAVAEALGAGWSGRDTEHGYPSEAYLDGPDGQRLIVEVSRRVEIRWWIDLELQRLAPKLACKSITVSFEKPAARAADDIRRRLLSGLPEALRALEELKRQSGEEAAQQAAYLAEVAQLIGGEVRRMVRYEGHRSAEVRFGTGAAGGTIEHAVYDGVPGAEIAVTARLPPALMLQVAKVIGEGLRGDGSARPRGCGAGEI